MNNEINTLLGKHYKEENSGWCPKNTKDHEFSVHFLKHDESMYCVIFDISNSYKHFVLTENQWLDILRLLDFFSA